MPRRYFSLDEAQALIPRFTAVLRTALQLHAHLRTTISDLEGDEGSITFGMLRGDEDFEIESDEELAAFERARLLYSALRESVDEIEATGAEVKGVVDGLVDFYSWRDGQTEVLLCWKLGDLNIGHFHDLEAGFKGRRPVGATRFVAEQSAVQAPETVLPVPAPAEDARPHSQ